MALELIVVPLLGVFDFPSALVASEVQEEVRSLGSALRPTETLPVVVPPSTAAAVPLLATSGLPTVHETCW